MIDQHEPAITNHLYEQPEVFSTVQRNHRKAMNETQQGLLEAMEGWNTGPLKELKEMIKMPLERWSEVCN